MAKSKTYKVASPNLIERILMNFGQQIQFLDNQNKWNHGTVVARSADGGSWGVSRNMRPNQQTKPDLFVSQDGSGNWRDFTSKGAEAQPVYNIGASQQLYTNKQALNNGRFGYGEKIPNLAQVKQVGLGSIAYRKSFNNEGSLR